MKLTITADAENVVHIETPEGKDNIEGLEALLRKVKYRAGLMMGIEAVELKKLRVIKKE